MQAQNIETLQDFVELVQQTDIRLMMGAVFTTPKHPKHEWLLYMAARYENIDKIGQKQRKDNWGCLLGIYAFHLCPDKLTAYQNAQESDATGEAFDAIELDFMDRFHIEFKEGTNPFRLWKWTEAARQAYLSAATDKSRKKVACEYLLENAIEYNK